MNEKICAVVVTYNRISLLRECIDALRNQTRKLDEIIVVNNNSNDGTNEWLENQIDLTSIHQQNTGGAGGFYTGIKTAYENQYDWVWCMDDDCLPRLDALENILSSGYKTNALLNSVVVDKSNNSNLTFGLFDFIEKRLFVRIEEIKDRKLINTANLFNGTLIHKDVIKKIGYPIKEFFIYGDDYEYFLRIKTNGIEIKTVVASIVEHPEQKHIYIGKWKLFYRINEFNSLGVKYFPRNIMAIWYYYDEFTFRKLLKTYIYDLIGILIIQKRIDYFLRYMFSIFQGIFFIKDVKKMFKAH